MPASITHRPAERPRSGSARCARPAGRTTSVPSAVAEHQRHEHEPGAGRRDAAHLLHEQRHEEDAAPEQHPAREVHADAHPHDRVTEDPQRQHRLRRPPLLPARRAATERERRRRPARRAGPIPTAARGRRASPPARGRPARWSAWPSPASRGRAGSAGTGAAAWWRRWRWPPRPTGRLTRNAHRQLRWSTNRPPTIGPGDARDGEDHALVAEPATELAGRDDVGDRRHGQRRRGRRRRGPARTGPPAAGPSSAPAPQATEATRKIAMATSRTRLRP